MRLSYCDSCCLFAAVHRCRFIYLNAYLYFVLHFSIMHSCVMLWFAVKTLFSHKLLKKICRIFSSRFGFPFNFSLGFGFSAQAFLHLYFFKSAASCGRTVRLWCAILGVVYCILALLSSFMLWMWTWSIFGTVPK